LIDITQVRELNYIRLDEDNWIHLGPLVTHSDVAKSALIQDRAVALANACYQVGSPQIRNRGTLAGNIVTASPSNDAIPPLLALGSRVTLSSIDGSRVVPLQDFFKGVRQTVIDSHEMVTDIAFPAPSADTRTGFCKLALRRSQAVSLVSVAAVVELTYGKVRRAAITLGAVAPTVIHARDAEEALVGSRLTAKAISQVALLARASAQPISDIRASASYRTEMVEVMTDRVLRSLAQGNERAMSAADAVFLRRPSRQTQGPRVPEAVTHGPGSPIAITINGRPFEVTMGRSSTLLQLLRENMGLTGTKDGCAEGECGACTVIMDGMAVMSCLVPAPRAHGSEIETIEGLSKGEELHPLQRAFIEEGAIQCGYCTPGLLMASSILLEEVRRPTRSQIKQALAGNLCRCTGYYRVVTAIEKAAAVRVLV